MLGLADPRAASTPLIAGCCLEVVSFGKATAGCEAYRPRAVSFTPSPEWWKGHKSHGKALHVLRGFQCRAGVDERRLDGMTFAQQAQDYFSEDENLNFFQRLARAWQILFPKRRTKTSDAAFVKQRLKMILISDRCSVSDEAKRRIVTNIVGALSDFVEIESEDKVQLNVSADPDLGTVYAVTVPVRRVKPEYQEYSRDMKDFEGIQYGDGKVFGEVRTLDIRFENVEVSETEAD